jgi:hypothetical protein
MFAGGSCPGDWPGDGGPQERASGYPQSAPLQQQLDVQPAQRRLEAWHRRYDRQRRREKSNAGSPM